MDHAHEPEINAPDEIAQAHARALREVAEFMRDNPGKFLHRQPRHERHADGEHEIISEKAEQAAAETCRGIDITVKLDALWHRRADDFTNTLDECVEQRLVSAISGDGPLQRLVTFQSGVTHSRE